MKFYRYFFLTSYGFFVEGGTIANIEVQKIGYMFLGERASCYVADLLLRQYKRVRELSSEKNIPFNYRDIPPVYTIVFMETSPSVFKDYPDVLMHTFRTISDSGLELNMLQNVMFIPIDIFLGKLHNEDINSEFEAWLTFLGCDEPQYIIELINKYPFFKDIYQDLYDMCLNVERVMNMFSKELQELDHNTVIYMMDEYQEQLDDIKSQLDDAQNQLDDTKNQLDDTKNQLDDTKNQLDDTKNQLEDAKYQLDDTKNQLDDTKNQLDSANTIIADRDFAIAEMSIIIQKYKDKFGEI